MFISTFFFQNPHTLKSCKWKSIAIHFSFLCHFPIWQLEVTENYFNRKTSGIITEHLDCTQNTGRHLPGEKHQDENNVFKAVVSHSSSHNKSSLMLPQRLHVLLPLTGKLHVFTISTPKNKVFFFWSFLRTKKRIGN